MPIFSERIRHKIELQRKLFCLELEREIRYIYLPHKIALLQLEIWFNDTNIHLGIFFVFLFFYGSGFWFFLFCSSLGIQFLEIILYLMSLHFFFIGLNIESRYQQHRGTGHGYLPHGATYLISMVIGISRTRGNSTGVDNYDYPLSHAPVLISRMA